MKKMKKMDFAVAHSIAGINIAVFPSPTRRADAFMWRLSADVTFL
jgi:hypothetical protein